MFRARIKFRFGSLVRSARVERWFSGRRIFLIPVIILFLSSLLITVFYINKVSASYTCLNGGDHGGAVWDPATDCPGGMAGGGNKKNTPSITTRGKAALQTNNSTQKRTGGNSATTKNKIGEGQKTPKRQ